MTWCIRITILNPDASSAWDCVAGSQKLSNQMVVNLKFIKHADCKCWHVFSNLFAVHLYLVFVLWYSCLDSPIYLTCRSYSGKGCDANHSQQEQSPLSVHVMQWLLHCWIKFDGLDWIGKFGIEFMELISSDSTSHQSLAHPNWSCISQGVNPRSPQVHDADTVSLSLGLRLICIAHELGAQSLQSSRDLQGKLFRNGQCLSKLIPNFLLQRAMLRSSSLHCLCSKQSE